MKKRLLISSFCLSGFFAGAQSITPDVLASAGDHFSNPSGQLSYTLGELLIETETAGSNIITQGFHQPDLLITSLTSFDPVVSANVFPNPANLFFNVRVTGTTDPVQILVFDTQGKLMQQQTATAGSTERMDASTLPAGIYFIRITGNDGKLLHTAKLIRSN